MSQRQIVTQNYDAVFVDKKRPQFDQADHLIS